MHSSIKFLIRALDFLRYRWRRSLSSRTQLELNGIQDVLSFKGEELGKCLRHLAGAFSVNIASQSVCMEEWDEIGQVTWSWFHRKIEIKSELVFKNQELKKLRKITRRIATEAKARLEGIFT